MHTAKSAAAAYSQRKFRKKTKPDITQQRIPRNPKYVGVASVVKTGSHAGNRRKKFDTSKEVFKRITRRTLARLFRETDEKEESVFGLASADTMSVITLDEDNQNLKENTGFLVVDVRDKADYDKCHIHGSLHYPAIKLRRDQWLPELFKFRNKPDHIIVIYDNDGFSKLGIDTATVFVEKRFNNIRLLTGGLCAFAEKFPDYVNGSAPTPPSSPLPIATSRASSSASKGKNQRKLSSRGSRPSTSSSLSSLRSYDYAPSVASSTMSSVSSRSRRTSRSNATRRGSASGRGRGKGTRGRRGLGSAGPNS